MFKKITSVCICILRDDELIQMKWLDSRVNAIETFCYEKLCRPILILI